MTALEAALLYVILILVVALIFSIRSTRLWIEYARVLKSERHVRGPVPEELFTVEADRDTNYLPGDKVHITLKPNDVCEEFSGGYGVVTHGPDNENGWLVSSAPGTLRCVASELTMLIRREDR